MLVDEAFEALPDFFYPTRAPHHIRIKDNRQVDTRTAHVAEAEIPYVRLRDKLLGSDTHPTAGFDQTIERAQHTLDFLPNLPVFLIVPSIRRIYIGETDIALQPVELVLYTQLALARVEQEERGNGFLSLDDLDNRRGELLQSYERLYGRHSERVNVLRKKWTSGTPRDSVRSHFANINRKIREVVPDRSQALLYIVDSEGEYGATRYGLRLPPEKIELREESP